MRSLVFYVLARLGEASTLRGLILLLFGLAGYQIGEEQAMQLIAAGQIIAGALGVVLPDRVREWIAGRQRRA